MEKLHFLTLMFVMSSTILFTQEDVAPEFCPPGAVWYYNSVDGREPIHVVPGHHPYFKVHYDRDTILAGKKAKVLIETLYTIDTIWIYNEILLYQDNWKIYSWEDGDFRILYDYTLSIGDHYTIYFEPRFLADGLPEIVLVEVLVDSVKTVTVNGEEMRAYHVRQIENDFFEYGFYGWNYFKIGNLNLFRIINELLCDSQYCPYEGLRCYSDSTFFWQTGDLPCDVLLVNSVADNKKDELKLYPNPTRDILFLQTGTYEVSEVTIFSVGGSRLRNFEVSDNEVKLGDLPPGIYFLQVELANRRIWKKILKI